MLWRGNLHRCGQARIQGRRGLLQLGIAALVQGDTEHQRKMPRLRQGEAQPGAGNTGHDAEGKQEYFGGGVIGDLTSRRGQVRGQESRGNATVINAMVPLANMFGYVNTLRSMSQGRAQFTMQFDHYAQVPQAVAEEVRAMLGESVEWLFKS